MINYIKDKYYWFSIYSNLKKSFKNKSESKILLFGYPKSGNTWLRFMIFNYSCLLENQNINKTISFEKLNLLQNNVLEKGLKLESVMNKPIFYRTHSTYNKCYDLFNYKIFIHRNPLDTLISAYYYYKNREIPFYSFPAEIRSELKNIDFFVKYNFSKWLDFYNSSISTSDVTINYSKLKSDCFSQMKILFTTINWPIEDKLIQKSINMSSIINIKTMASELKQENGMASKSGKNNFKGVFVRSGEESQFKAELDEETINYVFEKFPKFNIIYPDLIE